jgi:imidazolonepropionase-like amidohydrolase
VRENLLAGADFIKAYVTDTVYTPGLPCYPSREELAVLVAEAHRLGRSVAAHCIGGPGLDLCLELGVDVIEHGYFATRSQLERLRDSGAWLTVTPTPILSDAYGACVGPELAEGFRQSRAPLRESMSLVMELGVPFALGSDGLHGQLHQDMAYAVELGASNRLALQAATIQAARLCGLAKETGSIERGKAADLVGLRHNPLLDIRAAAEVALVIADGRTLFAS